MDREQIRVLWDSMKLQRNEMQKRNTQILRRLLFVQKERHFRRIKIHRRLNLPTHAAAALLRPHDNSQGYATAKEERFEFFLKGFKAER